MKLVDLMAVYLNECQLHAEVLADEHVGCADRRIYSIAIQKMRFRHILRT